MKTKFFKAIAALVGTVIGAGIFAVPYVIAKIGFFLGIFYLLILASLVLLLNLIYGEVVLRTPGDHQLTGYAEIYLGKKGKILATLAIFISGYGALLAYLIKTGQFLALISGYQQPVLFSFLFFLFFSAAVFLGIKSVSFLNSLLVVFLLILVFFLLIFSSTKINLVNLFHFDFSFLFLPYGVLLFALSGFSVIPEMEEILRKEHQHLKKAIIIGSFLPALVYLLFALVVVGVCGEQTSDDAIVGLSFFLPNWIINLGAILGLFTMGTSYLNLGYVLREVWFRDFHLPKFGAFLLAVFPSLLLFLSGAQSFIDVLSATGSLMTGLTGILILLMFCRAKKMGKRPPAYSLKLPFLLVFILMVIFLVGSFSFLIRLSS